MTGIIHEALSCGDYGCQFEDGYRPPFYFERKSLGDLYGTMTHGYKRFKKELERAKSEGIKLFLLCEDSLQTVSKGYSHSSLGGDSLVRKLFTLRVRYDLEAVFCGSRWECKRYIIEFYEAVGREYTMAKSAARGRGDGGAAAKTAAGMVGELGTTSAAQKVEKSVTGESIQGSLEA